MFLSPDSHHGFRELGVREGDGEGVHPKQKHVGPDPTIYGFYPVSGAEEFVGSVGLTPPPPFTHLPTPKYSATGNMNREDKKKGDVTKRRTKSG